MTYRLRRGAWGALVATALATTTAALPTTAHADSTGPLIAYQAGGTIYVANQDGTDPRSVVDVGDLAIEFSWSPDGTSLYYQGVNGVHRVDLEGSNDALVAYNSVNSLLNLGGGFAIDPSDTLVVGAPPPTGTPVSCAGLNAVPADGSAPAQTALLTSSCFLSPTFDPANGQLVGESDDRSALMVMDADDQVRQIATSADFGGAAPDGIGAISRLLVSPDGTHIAVVANDEMYVATLTYSGTGAGATLTGITAPQPLDPADTSTGFPHWSPDSSAVITTVQGSRTGVASIPIDGDAPTLLPLPTDTLNAAIQPSANAAPPAPQLTVPMPQQLPDQLPAAPPIASRTNGMVAYLADDALVVANSDGSEPHTLPVGKVQAFTWSPDGRRIYYATPDTTEPGELLFKSVLPNGTAPVTVTGDLASPLTATIALDATGRYLEYVPTEEPGQTNLDIVPADGSAPATPSPLDSISTNDGGAPITAVTTDPVTNEPLIGKNGAVTAVGADGQRVALATAGNPCDAETGACPAIAVSPDGARFAYVDKDSTGARLMVATLTYAGSGATARVTGVAGPPVAVVTTTGSLSLDSWTPDGSAIVYSTSSDGQTHTIAPTGGTPVDLSAFTGDADVSYQPVGSDTPTAPNIALHGIDSVGMLFSYGRTGQASAPLATRQDDYSFPGTNGWGAYATVLRAGDVSGDSRPDVLAVDGSGGLYLFEGTTDAEAPYTPPTQVGHGWQIYNQIVGVGDVTGDGKADLVARDASGELWLYQGNSNPADPFATRVQIGGGWNTYNQIIGAGDLTGDGKPDLITRDTTGNLWLYAGTGKTTAPFASRVKIGGGWNTYNQIIGAGDLTGDGKPDLIARDTTGSLWLYQGTGTTTAPFATRVQIGHGWQIYNQLF